jgi:hypothetical protein
MTEKPTARVCLLIGGIILGTFTIGSCSKTKVPITDTESSISAQCRTGVVKLLGPDAEVVKCGRLTGTDTVQAIGLLKIKQLPVTGDGWPVSRLVVAQFRNDRWQSILTASKDWIRNDAGYIGLDYIDDSYQVFGYRAALSESKAGPAALLLSLSFLRPNGESEGIPIQIAWNRDVQRYQEVVNNDGPFVFQAENSKPPHRKTQN